MIKNKTIITLSLIAISSVILEAESMPYYAKPGQCFTKAFYPPEFKKTTKTTISKRVLIRKGTIIQKVIPAKYEWIEKKIKISDGKEKIVTTPAVYKTVYENILVEPKEYSWRKSLNPNAPKALPSCVQAASNSGIDISNAQPNSCFYEHYIPAKYTTTTEKILVAQPSKRLVSTPAKYKTYTKKIEVDSTKTKLIPIKAKYKNVKEKVVISPDRTEWRKTTCQNRGCNEAEVVCLVEIPRKYKEVTRKVLLEPSVGKRVSVSPKYKSVEVEEMVQPASVKEIPIPAKYKTITKKEKLQDARYFWSDESQKSSSTRLTNQCNKICLVEKPAKYQKVAKKILLTPASSKKIKTPPKYTIVKVKKIIEPAKFKKVVVPAEYKTVTVERERTKGYSKWTPVVCESNMTPTTIKKVQDALKRAGYYQGQINGIWDLESKKALRAYQKANGLAVTRLSIESMKSLGIY
ncbi:MAG: peptidoglycan-binding protein [Epsilonproteobacteria bacterium]|nr:peptidoglycan-binding protein [Campylobacterota bacterium]